MKTVSYLTLVTAICVVILSGTAANASWQLIPGMPFDGQGPRTNNYNYNYSEPCWSAATSKCAREQRRQKAPDQLNRAKRISR
jgi:hypothetical protein